MVNMVSAASPAVAEDAPMVGMLADAYRDEPLLRWVFADKPDRRKLVQAHLEIQLAFLRRHGFVGSTPAGEAVIGCHPPAGVLQLDVLAELEDSLLWAAEGAADRLRVCREALATMEGGDDRHVVTILALAPAMRRTRVASVLIGQIRQRILTRWLPLYGHATSGHAFMLCRRAGAELAGEPVRLPDNGPVIYPMQWTPRLLR